MLLGHGRGFHAGELEQLSGFAIVGQRAPLRVGGNQSLGDGIRDITNAVGNVTLEKGFGAGLKFGRHFSVGLRFYLTGGDGNSVHTTPIMKERTSIENTTLVPLPSNNRTASSLVLPLKSHSPLAG